MTTPQLFRKSEERTFFAHHMLLHAAEREVVSASESEVGRFNKCLSAMVLTSLAVEALANAVGSRVASDWASFEAFRPHEKIDMLVERLGIRRAPSKEPWTTVQYIGGFRNDIAHPKPEVISREHVLPEVALEKRAFSAPPSRLEREISLGNAKRMLAAVQGLKGILTDAMPMERRFGIYADMWHGSTSAHEA